MQLQYAFLADLVQVNQGKLYVLGGDIDRLSVQEFPCNPRLSLVQKFMLEPGELDRPHTFTVTVMDEDGKKVFAADQEIKVERNAQNESWRHQGFLLPAEFIGAIKFEKPGDYSFEILVDKINVKSLPLHISLIVQEPTAA